MALYQQDGTPIVRRGLALVLWLILTVVVLSTLVWFVFYRDTSPKVAVKRGAHTAQKQRSNTKSSDASSGSNTNTATPSQLVNTGAGNIVVPFVVASMAGSVLYYVRLRRKLLG